MTRSLGYICALAALLLQSCNLGPYHREHLSARPFVVNLAGINTEYDDFNSAAPPSIRGNTHFIYSTNAGTAGDNFDIWEAYLSFSLDQETIDTHDPSDYPIESYKIAPFLHAKCNSPGDELGPSFLCPVNGCSTWDDPAAWVDSGALYLLSSNRAGDQDVYYFSSDTLRRAEFNRSGSDQCYATWHAASRGLYFCSNQGGNFDMYVATKGDAQSFTEFLGSADSATACASLNSAYDDKCPYILDSLLVFVSNRGSAGQSFDIYYSQFESGSWTVPAKFPVLKDEYDTKIDLNSASNEYRPILMRADVDGADECYVVLFSSDRPRHTYDTRSDYDLYMAMVPVNQLK